MIKQIKKNEVKTSKDRHVLIAKYNTLGAEKNQTINIEPLFFSNNLQGRTDVNVTGDIKQIVGRRYLKPLESINLMVGAIDPSANFIGAVMPDDTYQVTILLGNKDQQLSTLSTV